MWLFLVEIIVPAGGTPVAVGMDEVYVHVVYTDLEGAVRICRLDNTAVLNLHDL